jgi:hypothetical protein
MYFKKKKPYDNKKLNQAYESKKLPYHRKRIAGYMIDVILIKVGSELL